VNPGGRVASVESGLKRLYWEVTPVSERGKAKGGREMRLTILKADGTSRTSERPMRKRDFFMSRC